MDNLLAHVNSRLSRKPFAYMYCLGVIFLTPLTLILLSEPRWLPIPSVVVEWAGICTGIIDVVGGQWILVRRMHDLDATFFSKEGIILQGRRFIDLFLREGSAGDNQFGPNPKKQFETKTSLLL